MPPEPEPEVELEERRRTDTSETLHATAAMWAGMWGEQISEREISEPVCESEELVCEADLVKG